MPTIDLKKISKAQETSNIIFVIIAFIPAMFLILPCLALKIAQRIAEEIFQWLEDKQ